MRKYECKMGGEELVLVANFAASLEIANKVADPLKIAREASLEQMMMEKGIPYNPKWGFTVENIPEILHIGLKAADSKLSLSRVQELVFEVGFAAARDHAMEYLALIVGPAPEEPDTNAGKSEGN